MRKSSNQITLAFIVSAVVAVFGMQKARAGPNQDECAIWLCITVGFALPECRPAHRAMVKRMLDFKSPVPGFGSCSADGNSNGFDAVYGDAALLDTQPRTYQHSTRCYQRDHNEGTNPPNCIGSYRFLFVTQHGEQIGETIYIPIRKPRGPGCNGDPTVPDC